MKLSESKISFSVKSNDEKSAENYGNFDVAEKSIVSKISKILIPKLDSTN